VTRIAILDYGMGNLRSVEKALERVGADAERTYDPERVRAADAVVLPGVGAFPKAMERIGELGLNELIADRVAAGVPVLGICLGFQLVFSSSTELGGAGGLDLVEGPVTGLEAGELKLPHMGWEPVRWERESELTDGIADGTPFYFVHSFVPRPAEEADVVGTAVHGERFACVIDRPPLYGVQFHPEKSSGAGLRLLRNFAGLAARAAQSQDTASRRVA
jgi:glutamine amidotransferase